MKGLSKLAVTKVHFDCEGIWHLQSKGLVMGASLAVILANVWMKSFEASMRKPEVKMPPDPTKTGSAKSETGE